MHVDLVIVTGSTNLVNMAGDYFEAGPAQMFTHHTQYYWLQFPRIGRSDFQLTESVPVLSTDILPCLRESSLLTALFPCCFQHSVTFYYPLYIIICYGN